MTAKTPFRIVRVTSADGQVTSALALATGPALDVVRAIVPDDAITGREPAVVTLLPDTIVRLHRITQRIRLADERYEAAVTIASALHALARDVTAVNDRPATVPA